MCCEANLLQRQLHDGDFVGIDPLSWAERLGDDICHRRVRIQFDRRILSADYFIVGSRRELARIIEKWLRYRRLTLTVLTAWAAPIHHLCLR